MKPVKIAITFGDPAGIGPEVTLKALSRKRKPNVSYLLLAPAAVYSALAKDFRLKLRFQDVSSAGETVPAGAIPCLSKIFYHKRFKYGVSQNTWTADAVHSIESAVKLAMNREIDAIVTPPINKAGLKKAGFNIPGHTEYLAKLSKTKKFEMMLVGGPLKVVLVTRHIPIKLVAQKVTRRRIEEAIHMTDQELRRSFGIKKPRIAVCGLNPHAGEKGTIGTEELSAVGPAVSAMKKKIRGVLTGPYSPDALFYEAYQGKFDAVVCMYHDQGLIPLKMVSRGQGVNVTLGLPFVRTSPDHGTGYDIAGKGKADAGSMSEAIDLAVRLALNRRKYV